MRELPLETPRLRCSGEEFAIVTWSQWRDLNDGGGYVAATAGDAAWLLKTKLSRHARDELRSAIAKLDPIWRSTLFRTSDRDVLDDIVERVRRGDLVLVAPSRQRLPASAHALAVRELENVLHGQSLMYQGRTVEIVSGERARQVLDSGLARLLPSGAARTLLEQMIADRGLPQPLRSALARCLGQLAAPWSLHATPDGLVIAIREASRSYAANADEVLTPSQLHQRCGRPLRVEFIYETDTGHAIEDPETHALVSPSGEIEPVTPNGGKIVRDVPEDASYELRIKRLLSASWSVDAVFIGEEVSLDVRASGFPNGTKVSVRIGHAYANHQSAPVAELDAQLQRGHAFATWRYSPQPGDPLYARLVFHARVGRKSARSDILEVLPHEGDTLRGIQERLSHLGYPAGEPADAMTADLERALRRFQEDHPPLAPSGTPDPFTIDVLAAL